MNEPSSLDGMTLRPSRFKAFLISFAVFGILFVATFMALIWLVESRLPGSSHILLAVLAAAAIGLFVAVYFTPTELAFDGERLRIEVPFPRPADYRWEQLEFYSPVLNAGLGVQRFKFEGLNLPYQIATAGFNRREWKAFQEFLRERFPEKRQRFARAMFFFRKK